MLGSCGNLNDKQYSPCDECSYKMLRISGQCTPLHCMYGLLNKIAKLLWDEGETDTLIDSRPTFIVSAEEDNKDVKYAELLKLQKEKNAMDDRIALLKSELGYLPKS